VRGGEQQSLSVPHHVAPNFLVARIADNMGSAKRTILSDWICGKVRSISFLHLKSRSITLIRSELNHDWVGSDGGLLTNTSDTVRLIIPSPQCPHRLGTLPNGARYVKEYNSKL
jgi:hypothetical protein